MTKRAVLYARVSGDDRKKEDRNLEGQLDMCREYALQRGYEVVEELAEDDRGASGAAFELPHLNRIRELAQGRGLEVLVTRDLDRLSRNLAKQLFVEDELKRSGVAIEYVLGEYPDTAEGNLMKNIRASVAEFERLKITERMVRGRELRVRAGSVLVQQRPPYGYFVQERDGKYVLEINEQEANVVRMVFSWYANGDVDNRSVSVREIQKRLSELKVPTLKDLRNPGPEKKRGWGQWSPSSVYRMLRNETYKGRWYYGKQVVRNGRQVRRSNDELLSVDVPAIVTPELWDAAQARMKRNYLDAARNLKYEYLIGRRVRCGRCGVKMTGDTSKRGKGRPYLYYRCPATGPKNLDYSHTCDLPGFRVAQVDEIVWQWVRELLTDPDALACGLAALEQEREQARAPIRERLGVVDRLLAEQRGQFERLLDLYLSGGSQRRCSRNGAARLSRRCPSSRGSASGCRLS